MSNHDLLHHWPLPKLVQDVASFVGFLQFYSSFIPHFEVCTLPLRKIMTWEYTEPVGDMWTAGMNSAFKSLKIQSSAILAFIDSTIANSPCCAQICQPWDLGMLYVSQGMTTAPRL
jgi:hypothetical protein